MGLASWLVAVSVVLSEEPPASTAEGDYLIGVEDRLQVAVWREPDLNRTVLVRPDGKITFPLIGDLQAVGRAPRQLAEDIGRSLTRFLKEPVVTVTVEEINHFRVYVLGEVGRQGELQLRKPTRLLQVLALAGGLTQYANRGDIILIRDENGKELRQRIDYRKIVNGDRPDLNIFLKPGDTIFVP